MFLCSCVGPIQNKNAVLFTIESYAGNGGALYSGDGGKAVAAQLSNPVYTAFDTSGNLYVADWGNNVIRRIDPKGTITTYAGNGAQGYSGDNGAATSAELDNPNAVAFDQSGNLYISDWGNNRIRKVSVRGVITTFAGSGSYDYTGDGGPATQAGLRWPTGVAVDGTGIVYFSDSNNNVVRKVDSSGTISTYAGNGGTAYAGDGGPAASAQFDAPGSLLADSKGNLYISDYNHHAVRKIDPSGIVTTVAGNGNGDFSGDGGPASAAELKDPGEIAFDTIGNLFIADSGNNRIRQVSPLGRITTVAGNGTDGYSGDGALATSAALNVPNGICTDASGNLFIADSSNNRVREVVLEGAVQQNTSSPNPQGQNSNPSGSSQATSQ